MTMASQVQGRKEIGIEIHPDGKERHSYPYVNDFSIAVGYHITKRIGNWVYKVKHLRKTGYLPHLILSKEEDILHVIAHELRHQWQDTRRSKSLWYYNTNTKKRTKKGDKTDADAYAITTVRRWRKLHQ